MKGTDASTETSGLGHRIRILHLEDSPEDGELVRSLLETEVPGMEMLRVETATAFRSALESGRFDLVVSDFTLPSFDAFGALEILREGGYDIPFIVVSGMLGEDRAVEALKAGATDYVLKDRLFRLGSAVGRALEESRVRRKRREAEAALQRYEERLKLVTRATSDAIWDWDLTTNKVWLSDGFETLFGYDVSELEADFEFFASRLHPEDREATLAGIRAAIEGDATTWSGEFRFRKADGSYGYVFDRRSVMREGGRAVWMIGATIDITARKLAEEELRQSEGRYRSIVETTNEWIWAMDLAGMATYNNQAVQAMLGYPPDEMTRQDRLTFIHPEDLPGVEQLIARSIARGEGWSGYVIRWRHRDGSYRYLESNAVLVFDSQGEPTGFRGADRDITERIGLEAQLLQSQKMEAIGTLAGGIAHDFNNLLTSILGYSDIVLQELGEGHPLQDDVEEIRKAGDRAAALTSQLLAFSRKQILTPIVLDLNDVLADIEKMLRRLIGEDLEMITLPDLELGKVKADQGQLDQVLMNLVVNARDAMPRGGSLTIQTSNVELDDSYVRSHPGSVAGSYVCLAVSDTGIGMDEETQARIFEPFFTTKGPGQGTGLGLSTVYGIVKQSGGHLFVSSELGKGTTFRVYLTRVFDEDETMPAAQQGKPAAGRETILLVEDEDGVRALVKRMLQSQGYVVIDASSGEEALRLAQAHAGPLHLLLTDAVMPGMKGSELARRITADRPETPVIFMSGYMDDAVARHTFFEGATTLIQKPFTVDLLAHKIRGVLDGAGAPGVMSPPPRDVSPDAEEASAR